MTPALRIREADPADIPQITAIYAREVNEGSASFELEPPSESEVAERFQAIVIAGLPYLVAETEGTVAAYAYAGSYRARPAYRFTVENSVYVAHWAQRQGIGRRLLEALIDRCRQCGKHSMVAIIGDSGHVASIRLHEQLGFRLVGALIDVGFKHDRWLDSVIMQRELHEEIS